MKKRLAAVSTCNACGWGPEGARANAEDWTCNHPSAPEEKRGDLGHEGWNDVPDWCPLPVVMMEGAWPHDDYARAVRASAVLGAVEPPKEER